MANITPQQALELAAAFRTASNKLGDFRFKNWTVLNPDERQVLEDEEWTLINYGSDLVTKAVGIALNDAAFGLKELMGAVEGAAKVVKKIKTAKKAIELAGTLVALGAAVVTKDPGAIATAATDVYKIIKQIKDLQKADSGSN